MASCFLWRCAGGFALLLLAVARCAKDAEAAVSAVAVGCSDGNPRHDTCASYQAYGDCLPEDGVKSRRRRGLNGQRRRRNYYDDSAYVEDAHANCKKTCGKCPPPPTPPPTPANPKCYEAFFPDFLGCYGWPEYGYTCRGNFCAAMDPTGDPDLCAAKAPAGYKLDPTQGRCVPSSTELVTEPETPDWRDDDEKKLECSVADAQQQTWTQRLQRLVRSSDAVQDTLCTDRLYHNMDGSTQSCKDSDGTSCKRLQYTALGVDSAFTSCSVARPQVPKATTECGYTVLTVRRIEARFKKHDPGVDHKEMPAFGKEISASCCVGGACNRGQHTACSSGKQTSRECYAMQCTVKKWTRCTVPPGNPLEWRRKTLKWKSGDGTKGEDFEARYIPILPSSKIQCKTYKNCYCEFPDHATKMQRDCVLSDFRVPCSSS